MVINDGGEMQRLKTNQRGVSVIELILIMLILISVGAVGWYVWRQNSDKKPADNSNSQQAPQSKSDTEKTQKKSTCTDPSSSVVENIVDSIKSGNTAALEGYMAVKVNVILAASEGIGEQTPAQAVAEITNFIGDSSSTTWDFALSVPVLTSYKDGFYKSYFPDNAVVGKASNKKVISFSFDCVGKISTVFEAGNEDLLL